MTPLEMPSATLIQAHIKGKLKLPQGAFNPREIQLPSGGKKISV